MTKYNYLVELTSEVGVKKGTLEIFIKRNRIDGVLTLLAHAEPIHGIINQNGRCELYGKIVSLIKENEYTAIGNIQHNELSLNMQIGTDNYILKGIACNDEK